VKNLKLGIAICGALGLAGMVMGGLGEMLADHKLSTVTLLAAFGLPVVMAVMGLAKPPLLTWQAAVSLACFVLALFKLRVWELREVIVDMPAYWKLMTAGAGLGAILSVRAVIRPESRA
jgi:hypothetical protein